jgi:hypothetical protein
VVGTALLLSGSSRRSVPTRHVDDINIKVYVNAINILTTSK